MSGVPNVPVDDAAVITTMQSLGATSPERACRRSDIPAAILAKLPELVDRGLIREAGSGDYYLYVSSEAALPRSRSWRASLSTPQLRKRLLMVIILWLIVLLLPIILMQIESRH